MRITAALLCVLLPAAASASSLEALRAGAASSFHPAAPPTDAVPLVGSSRPVQATGGTVFFPLRSPLATEGKPSLLGSFRIADRLDAHRRLLRLRLGPSDWDVSMASDPAFAHRYLTFARGSMVRMVPFDNPQALLGDGLLFDVEPGVRYRARISPSIFSPARGSTLYIEPAQGVSGPSHQMKTGALFDALRANSYVFRADGRELWLLYGTDVDPDTGAFIDSRSLLLIQEDGTSTRMWPLAEQRLPLDQLSAWTFGGTTLTFLRGSNGFLSIFGSAR